MENTIKPITDYSFKLISELKYNISCIQNGDESVRLETVKMNLAGLRDECRTYDFEEEVDVLEGLESVVDSMINNKMSESAELFELILSGLEHTEKVLQIKGVMKKDLSKNLQATFQDLPGNFSPFASKKEKRGDKNDEGENEKPAENGDDVIVNFATGRKAKVSQQDKATEEPEENKNSQLTGISVEEVSANSVEAEKVDDAEPTEVMPESSATNNETPEKEKESVDSAIQDTTDINVDKDEVVVETAKEESKDSEEIESEEEITAKEETIEEVVTESTDVSMEHSKMVSDTTEEPEIEDSKSQGKEAETTDSDIIRISELTMHSIEKTKREIDTRLKDNKEVKIVAENVTAIDLSYIQLILAIRNNSSSEKMSFEFEGELNEDLRLLLNNNGFSGIA